MRRKKGVNIPAFPPIPSHSCNFECSSLVSIITNALLRSNDEHLLVPDDRNLVAPPLLLIKADISQMQKRVAVVACSKMYDGMKVTVDKRNNMVS